MKYIVIRVSMEVLKFELPFIFPDKLVHCEVARVMVNLLRDQYPLSPVEPVSAGFLSSMDFDCECFGESETLHLKSRGEVDSALIAMYDYGAGLG
jgi:hypothetical protein